MSSWNEIDAEISRWREMGRSVDLWWRDDDAIEPTPELDRLLELRRAADVPLALAVVPASARERLASRLDSEDGVVVLQHGYAHMNHAGAAEKKIELGLQRPAMMVLGELGTGWLALERLFGARARPILVPPWNRIAPSLVPALPEIGFKGLSTFGARQRPEPVRGFPQVNTHVDLIDWRGSRGFAGEASVLGHFAEALARARQEAEPIGILSHHLAMDEPAWDFLKSVWGRLTTMPGVRILPALGLFASREARV
jgi:hypothetical protein